LNKTQPLVFDLFSLKENLNQINWKSHSTLGRSETKIFNIYVNVLWLSAFGH